MIGADGFNWEEIEIETKRRTEDIYFWMRKGETLPAVVYFKTAFLNAINAEEQGTTLKLFSQGTAIFMLKKDRLGMIKTGRSNGEVYTRLGNSDFARKLYGISSKWEVIEAAEDYILFRPVKG